MDNPRIFLWIGLALLAWMNVIQWNRESGAESAAPPAATAQAPATGVSTDAGATSTAQLPAMPSDQPAATSSTEAGPAAGTAPAATAGTAAVAEQSRVRVMTDVFDLDISLQGGNVIRADLAKYPRDKRAGSPPVRLFATQEPDFHVARSGLRALNGRAEPTHLAGKSPTGSANSNIDRSNDHNPSCAALHSPPSSIAGRTAGSRE